jgi:hypothetical protein
MSSFTIDENMLNEDVVNEFRLSMDPNAIPDLGQMLNIINELLAFIETDNMIRMEKENKIEFERAVHGRYNAYLPIKIIKLMLEPDRYDHLSRLLDMFDILNNVKDGKQNIQDAYNNFSEKLNEKYIYPMHGGKANFEKNINAENINKKKKKKKNKNKKVVVTEATID